MMKRSPLPVIVLTLTLTFAAGVLAGTTQGEKPSADTRKYIGTVVATNQSTGTLIVKNWRGETVFDTSGARFGGQRGLMDLEPGERVLIRYVQEGGRKVATAIVEAAHKQEREEKPGAAARSVQPGEASPGK
jgi:hypothetical protein